MCCRKLLVSQNAFQDKRNISVQFQIAANQPRLSHFQRKEDAVFGCRQAPTSRELSQWAQLAKRLSEQGWSSDTALEKAWEQVEISLAW